MGRASDNRIWRSVTVVITGLLVAGIGVFLAAEGLDNADKWASIMALFVAIAGLGLSAWGGFVANRGMARQRLHGSIVGGGVAQVRGARGSVHIGRTADDLPHPLASTAGAAPSGPTIDGGDQSVTNTWTAGPVRQVDDVGGDVDIDR
ncbi:hypothetical protein KBX08_11520 [Micromonospora sp. H61]|uniref:hypothetical protein n=1 Tax=Micromonospora sp. H61 TaxID=2824888 RepID=UPI001B3697BF|nr:hypothetical protein [Micromonospora sp. H61]MBQ0990719.1 hypothetical protein [Micromonospora sp. H61]